MIADLGVCENGVRHNRGWTCSGVPNNGDPLLWRSGILGGDVPPLWCGACAYCCRETDTTDPQGGPPVPHAPRGVYMPGQALSCNPLLIVTRQLG